MNLWHCSYCGKGCERNNTKIYADGKERVYCEEHKDMAK